MPRNSKRKNLVYSIFGTLLIISVLSVIIYIIYIKPKPILRDEQTLCPINIVPSAITIILIDRTDKFSVLSKADIESQLHDLLDESQTNEMISLYAVDPIEKAPLRPITTICNPGSPKDVNPWTQNEDIIGRDWKSRFVGPLTDILKGMLSVKKADVSPIMQSIQSISITELGGNKYKNIPKKIVLVSDVLQNTSTFSLYKQKANYSIWSKSNISRGVNPDLRGVKFQIYYLLRQNRGINTDAQIINFWAEWIEAYGGIVDRILIVSGVN